MGFFSFLGFGESTVPATSGASFSDTVTPSVRKKNKDIESQIELATISPAANPFTVDMMLSRTNAMRMIIADSLDLGVILALHFPHEALKVILEATKFFLFPFAIFTNVYMAIYAIRVAWKERTQSKILHAVIETIAALVVAVAVMASLIFHTATAAIVPLVFTLNLAAKGFYHWMRAIYYGVSGYLEKDEVKKQAHNDLAKGAVKSATSLTLLALGVGFIMLMTSSVMHIIGPIVGVIGAVLGIFFAYKEIKKIKLAEQQKAQKLAETATQEDDANTHQQAKKLMQDNSYTPGSSGPPPPPAAAVFAASNTAVASNSQRVGLSDMGSSEEEDLHAQPKMRESARLLLNNNKSSTAEILSDGQEETFLNENGEQYESPGAYQ